MAIGFVLPPLLLEHLGSDRYGAWSYAASILAYFSLFDFGIRSAVRYWISTYRPRPNAVESIRQSVATSFWMMVPVAVFAGPVGFIVGSLTSSSINTASVAPWELTMAMTILAMVAGVGFLAGILEGVLTAHHRFDLYNAVESGHLVISGACLAVAALYGQTLVALGLAQTVSYALRFAALYVLARRVNPGLSLAPRFFARIEASHLFRFGWRKFVSDLARLVSSEADVLIVGAALGVAPVAGYVVAKLVTNQLYIASLNFSQVFVPRLTEVYSANNWERFRRTFQFCNEINFMIALCGSACIGSLLGPFLRLWVGESFVSGELLMRSDIVGQALLVAMICLVVQTPSTQAVVASGDLTVLVRWGIISAVATVVLALVLVQPFGLLGIAIARSIPAFVVSCIVLPKHLSKSMGISIRRSMLPAAGRAVLAAGFTILFAQVVVYVWQLSTWLQFSMAALAVGTAAAGVGWLTLSEDVRLPIRKQIGTAMSGVV